MMIQEARSRAAQAFWRSRRHNQIAREIASRDGDTSIEVEDHCRASETAAAQFRWFYKFLGR